jgi:hypothetical protein
MPWTNANSSMIEAYDYDAEMRVLHVKFPNGSIFSFKDVPADTAAEFEAAPSKGKFFHNVLKEGFLTL